MVFRGGLTLGPLLAEYLREKIGYDNMNAVLGGIYGLTAVVIRIYLGNTEENLDDQADQED
jgi:hypothetical protein